MHLSRFLLTHSCLACLRGAGTCVQTPAQRDTSRQAMQRACTDRQIIPLCHFPLHSWGSDSALVVFGLRFRSITKQYFRKADGILVMYDITAECSFVAVRNWMSSIQVRAGPGLQCCWCSLAPHQPQQSVCKWYFSVRKSYWPCELNYQSRCLWWWVWNQRLCVEGNKASGSPLK